MECIEARALKSSFLSEISTQQPCFEDMWCVTGFNNVPCDDFSVDDLLDLSDKDFKFASLEKDEETNSLSFSSHPRVDPHNSNSTTGDFDSLPAGELTLPVDDLDSLEWLSQFVDDSMSETSLLIPAGNWKEKTGKFFVNRNQPAKRMPVQKFSVLLFSSPVPKKVRTKRARPNRGVWSIGSLSFTELSSSSSSSSSFTSPLMLRSPVQVTESLFAFEKPAAKKQRKNPGEQTGSVLSGFQTQRRCTHCHVQKTPQWRTGPLGPKTLCNACGVRFKSGRLYPEYRPACSPTFSCDVHSNSHRKVLEMRRKKEVVDSVLTPAGGPEFLRIS